MGHDKQDWALKERCKLAMDLVRDKDLTVKPLSESNLEHNTRAPCVYGSLDVRVVKDKHFAII